MTLRAWMTDIVRERPCMSHSMKLNEYITAPEMLHAIDPRDLPTRDYAPLIPYSRLAGIRGNIMKFFVPSPTRINKWNFYIQYLDWDEQVRDTSLKTQEAAWLLYKNGRIAVHCGCPSFIFHGYEYILTQLDAAIRPETRYPHIRNPELRGILCKHGRVCMKTLGFYLGDMAKAIKQQRESYQF